MDIHSDTAELRGDAPADLVQALDGVGTGGRPAATPTSTKCCFAHVRNAPSDQSRARMLIGNPLMPRTRRVKAE